MEEIVDLTNGELVDVNDSKSQKKLFEVAKCVANGAKPQADVSWEFENNRGKPNDPYLLKFLISHV